MIFRIIEMIVLLSILPVFRCFVLAGEIRENEVRYVEGTESVEYERQVRQWVRYLRANGFIED